MNPVRFRQRLAGIDRIGAHQPLSQEPGERRQLQYSHHEERDLVAGRVVLVGGRVFPGPQDPAGAPLHDECRDEHQHVVCGVGVAGEVG